MSTSPGGPGPAWALKLPAYCRVDGVIDRRTGGDGKPYGKNFTCARNVPASAGRYLSFAKTRAPRPRSATV